MNFFSGNDLIFAKVVCDAVVKTFKLNELHESSETSNIHQVSLLEEGEREQKLIWVVVSPEEFCAIHGDSRIQDWAKTQAAYISLASRVNSLPVKLDDFRKDPVSVLQRIGAFLDVEKDAEWAELPIPKKVLCNKSELPFNVVLLARMAGVYGNY